MADLLEKLSLHSGMRGSDLIRIIQRAPNMYKSFYIPKRTGGVRLISQPAREVKVLQRALVKALLQDLPIHDAATAYRSGRSILDNARAHARSGPILKMDFEDFFPSIHAKDWVAYCQRTGCLPKQEEVHLTTRLMFFRESGDRTLRLAIGAPSSPMLSNILMYEFDKRIVEEVAKDRVIYTRYADDITFSAPRTGYLTGVRRSVAKVLRTTQNPKLSVNESKTTFITKKYHRTVTGLTLSNEGKVTIGHENKRKVHAAVHGVTLGRLSRRQIQELAGILAYINAAEPSFLDVLRLKYGSETILQVQKGVLQGEKLPSHPPPIAPVSAYIAGDEVGDLF